MVSYKKYYLITYQNNFSTNRKHHFQNLIIKRFTTEYNPTNLLIKDMQLSHKKNCGPCFTRFTDYDVTYYL